MNEEIKELLKKHLPAQVGETLKERLAQAERDEKTVKTHEGTIANLNKQLDEASKRIEDYQKFDERNRALNSREKELEAIEVRQEVEKLKYELQSEKDKSAWAREIGSGLVRNTNYRKTIFDSENPGGIGVMDANGYYHHPMPTSKNYNETQSLE